jgi:diguanylate cyclase (GGDEF)-like protein
MHEFAYFDVLTQLPNRRMLLDRLQQSIRLSRRNAQFNALLFFDLDNFKRVNDAFGHEAGDHMLREVARRASACMRETDTVARLGGDEFIVLIHQLDADTHRARMQVERIAEKLRSALNAPYRIEVAERTECAIERRCPASIGAILFDGQAESPDEVLRQGDKAMYRAKAHGGNGIHVGCLEATCLRRAAAQGARNERYAAGAPLH